MWELNSGAVHPLVSLAARILCCAAIQHTGYVDGGESWPADLSQSHYADSLERGVKASSASQSLTPSP